MKAVTTLHAALITLTSSVFAQGIKLEAKRDRFSLKPDKQVGAVVVDHQQKLEWMSCFVGQELRQDQCTGTPQRMNWFDAEAVSKQAGNGWRLPGREELMSIMARQSWHERLTHLSPHFHGQSSKVFVYWTASRVTNMTNMHWVVSGKEDLENLTGNRGRFDLIGKDEEEYEVRLVRNAK